MDAKHSRVLAAVALVGGGNRMARNPIHPGKFLADELEALGISAPELAAALHVPANRIYQILKGQRALTADTALRLSQWLRTSAELWMKFAKAL